MGRDLLRLRLKDIDSFNESRVRFFLEVDFPTLTKTNVAPENRPSQKETSIPTIHFQVRTVGFSAGNPAKTPVENSKEGRSLEKNWDASKNLVQVGMKNGGVREFKQLQVRFLMALLHWIAGENYSKRTEM